MQVGQKFRSYTREHSSVSLKKKKKDIKPHLDLSYILHLKANDVKDKLSQGRKLFALSAILAKVPSALFRGRFRNI